MRFSSTMDSLTKEIQFLKKVVLGLILVAGCLTVAVMVLFEKEPLIVERSVKGLEILKIASFERKEEDLSQALKIMAKARFDSNALSPELFLSSRQLELREAEQKEMKARSMSQAIVVRSIKITKNEALIEFDRVLSLGTVRSALATQVKVAFEESVPNELNPYGLKLAIVSPVDSKEVGK
ncbi:MAG TPA: hypothetical protein VIG33_04930 [Pseudobdellovibrionaceae bacterium]